MGCGLSKEKENNEQRSTLNTRSAEEIKQPAKAQGAKSRKGVCDDFTDDVSPKLGDENKGHDALLFSLEALPAYSKDDPHTSKSNQNQNNSAKIIIDTVQKAHRMQKHGINSGFNVLAERHIHVWIDGSYLLDRDTKAAIELQAALHLQLGQARNSDMTFFFTSYPNLHSEHLGESERRQLYQLLQVWETSSWSEAEKKVSRNTILRDHFSLKSWMENIQNFQAKGEDRKAAAEQAEQAEQDAASKMTLSEKHSILLAHIRDLMMPSWHGWHQSDFADVSDLFSLCKETRKNAKQQRKCLNSIRVMYQREIGLYMRLRDQNQAFPVTCFPLIGSMMQSDEVKAIKAHQKVGDKLQRQPTSPPPQKNRIKKLGRAPSSITMTVKDKIDAAPRRDLPFQITGLVDIEGMSEDGVKGFQDIDDAFEGEDDINDIKLYKHTMYLQSFFSPLALFLYYNGHNKEVDDVELRQEDMYGASPLTTDTDKTISIPHVTEFMKILGMDIEDWEQPKSKIRLAHLSKLDADEVTLQPLDAN